MIYQVHYRTHCDHSWYVVQPYFYLAAKTVRTVSVAKFNICLTVLFLDCIQSYIIDWNMCSDEANFVRLKIPFENNNLSRYYTCFFT